MTSHDDQHDDRHAPDHTTGARGSTEPRLCDEDCRALDHLAEHGFDRACVDALDGDERARCERMLACLGLVDHAPAYEAADGDDESLIGATLLRIDRAEREREAAMRLETGTATRSRGWRMPDLIAVAATFLLAIGVLWPVIQQVQNARQVARDSGNMVNLYSGIEAYANGHRGSTPLQADILPNVFDWLGIDYGSASGALDVLVADDYCDATNLYLPGGSAADSRYSVRIVPTSNAPRLFGAGEVIVSNHNPLARKRAAAASMPVSACGVNADCHGGRGQNLLKGDGSVHFGTTPDCSSGAKAAPDNMWLPNCPDGTIRCPVDRATIDSADVFLAN